MKITARSMRAEVNLARASCRAIDRAKEKELKGMMPIRNSDDFAGIIDACLRVRLSGSDIISNLRRSFE